MSNVNAEDLQNDPKVDMIFDTEEEAYQFYNNYGRRMGFSIRRQYVHRSKSNKSIITSARFVCSKQGIKKQVSETKNPQKETKINCLARMGIKLMDNGQYWCHDVVEDHNHPFQTPATAYMMRSQRKLSKAHAAVIDLADDSGLRPKAIFDYMGRQAGGVENLGHTKLDQKNYLRTKRQRDLAQGEGGSLLMYFEKQTRENPSFTYSLQLDSDEKIANVFWTDPRMIIDYALFGDVVTFDTTFDTNKEYIPFGLFAGFNHHRGVVIFGAALLYDETVDSFKWLFETFLEIHGHKKPITIFTDQDATKAKAIQEVLPETWH
ncbi:protein FAR1-RELATED SEQUENCE 5-like [Telopea speciosissima]|uniref:protein FAR1-RELATED SEQUENCE 5-like n=1 Tax=Telopea speciosissima TaxID=54955 RepID=UPI001CC4A35F|nr:protein FAR1-RELATED SEQUENCE 5-like [Telopea speciosissima]